MKARDLRRGLRGGLSPLKVPGPASVILFGCASDNRSQRRKKTPKQRKTWKTTSERACHGSEMHSCVLFVPKSPSRRGQARSAARCGGAPGATPRDHRGDRREHGQTQPKPRPNNGRKTDNGNAAAATTSRCAQNVVFSDLTSGQEQTSNRRCASGRLSDMGKIFLFPPSACARESATPKHECSVHRQRQNMSFPWWYSSVGLKRDNVRGTGVAHLRSRFGSRSTRHVRLSL